MTEPGVWVEFLDDESADTLLPGRRLPAVPAVGDVVSIGNEWYRVARRSWHFTEPKGRHKARVFFAFVYINRDWKRK